MPLYRTRNSMHLPLLACICLSGGVAALVGCDGWSAPVAKTDADEAVAPARLQLRTLPKPIPNPLPLAIAQAAHSEWRGSLELSASSPGNNAQPIREPASAQGAPAAEVEPPASAPAARYPDLADLNEVSHAPADTIPYLASRPRFQAPDDTEPARPAIAAPLESPVAAEPDRPAYAADAYSSPAPAQPAPTQSVQHQLPVPQPDPAQLAARRAAMQSVADRAAEISNRGYSMAQRGMLYAARAELIESLQLVAQALDVQQGNSTHAAALAGGLTALKEAQDFAGSGQASGVVDVAAISAAHSTPILKATAAEGLSPILAQQQYLAYAQSQLIAAAGQQAVASQSLYRLGRVQMAMAAGEFQEQSLAGPQAMVFQQAALGVDGRNYLAANELGVLMARYGQWAEARRLLLHSVTLQPHAEGWHNLSVVHRKLGEADLARRADYERELVARGKPAAGADSVIRWVDTRTFAASAGGEVPWPAAATATQQTAVRGSTSAGVKR